MRVGETEGERKGGKVLELLPHQTCSTMERQILEFLSPSPEVVAWKEMRKGEALESLSSQSQMVPVATGGILDLSAQTATCVANTYLFAMPDSIGHRETAYGGSQHIGVWYGIRS